jgi:hypothetical protein
VSARYFSVRRLNPYRGVVQFIDLGEADARSLDGITWHLRAEDDQGWVRPVGVWEQGAGLVAGVGHRYPALLTALEQRPTLPFPLADRVELWLLDKPDGRPFALLDACRPSQALPDPAALEWQPFSLTYQGFHSRALAESKGDRHRDLLSRQVNQRARPQAAAQWFYRQPDGSGNGLAGYRLASSWQERRLTAAEFPELLVAEDWNNRLEKSVIDDYHAWLSPFLLCWPGLSDATRARLEVAARDRLAWLAQVHRLLPRVIDREGLNAALVAARLQEANPETDSI